jgi:hypothetical protein
VGDTLEPGGALSILRCQTWEPSDGLRTALPVERAGASRQSAPASAVPTLRSLPVRCIRSREQYPKGLALASSQAPERPQGDLRPSLTANASARLRAQHRNRLISAAVVGSVPRPPAQTFSARMWHLRNTAPANEILHNPDNDSRQSACTMPIWLGLARADQSARA